jgi:hypothetical protein
MKSFWQIGVLATVFSLVVACNNNPAPTGLPVVESSQSNSVSIGAAGGRISATAKNGTVYTLTIPPEALETAQNIRLTPISSMGNAPLSKRVLAAVQFEPSGLKFKRPARLQISGNTVVPAGQKRFGFSSKNDGTGFDLEFAGVSNGKFDMDILHFSGAGVGNAPPEEIAEIPLVPIKPLTQEEYRQLMWDMALDEEPQAEIAKIVQEWFDKLVSPPLEAAQTDNTQMGQALEAYDFWLSARVRIAYISDGSVNLEPFLSNTDTLARAKVAAIIKKSLNKTVQECQAAAANTDDVLFYLVRMQVLQARSEYYFVNTPDFGLDLESLKRQYNDCARVVIDPITLPSLSVGSDVSLNATAHLVSTTGVQTNEQPFGFTVTAIGATVKTPEGLSDAAGLYTTVLTPSSASVLVDVRACLVLPDFYSNAANIVTDICGSGSNQKLFRGTISLESTMTSSRNFIDGENKDVSNVTATTSLTFEVNMEIVNGVGQVQIQKKTASFLRDSAFDSAFRETTGSCSFLNSYVSTEAVRGTSLVKTPFDEVSVRVNSNGNYTLRPNTGGQLTVTSQFNQTYSLPKPTGCRVPKPQTGSTNDTLPDDSYSIPIQVFATGSIQNNANGTRSIAGSLPFSETRTVQGSTVTTQFTLTWDLVER